jgi:hypothetical protein
MLSPTWLSRTVLAVSLVLTSGIASGQVKDQDLNYNDNLPPSEEGWDPQNGPQPVMPKAGTASPFTPGVQNTQDRSLGSPNPFSPGQQNSDLDIGASPFNPGSQNQNNGWSNGGNPWNRTTPQNNQNAGNQTQPQFWGPLTRPEEPKFTMPQATYSNLPIKISMPDGEAGICGYVLATGKQAWNYTIGAGKAQIFPEDRVWQVTYDRGGGFGPQVYVLKSGHYKFRQSNRGWELYRSELDAAPVAAAPEPPM